MLDTPSHAEALKRAFPNEAVLPDDLRYETMRLLKIGNYDKRPAAIVRPRTAADVARLVTFARDRDLELAVRSGGHGHAGYGSTDGGLVLDLRDMNMIEIDAAGRTAWAETGATAGEFTHAAGELSLAVGFGDTGSVGIGGITLGGGVGYLSRKFGLTIDSVLAAEVVTADGRVVTADAESEPDLFWAIRGGGGNFGVVTRIRFRLNEVPAFTGGMLILPATPEVVAGAVVAAEAAPDELSAILNVMAAPPMPFLPPEVYGKLIVMGLMAFAGPPAQAEAAFRPFRALATPLADMVKPSSYADMFPPEEDYRPSILLHNQYVDGFGAAEAEAAVERVASGTAVMRVVQIRMLGGAIARVPADATAYAHRNRKIMINVAAMFTSPDDRAVQADWVSELAGALGSGDSAYANFLVDEPEARVRAAYPGATWDRLRQIKRRYDPGNFFRMNQNIPPAA